MGFPLPEVGSVTEDVGVTGGLLSANGDADVNFVFGGDDTGGWTAETISGAFGSALVIDVDGVWSYTADNNDAAIQALNLGETLTEVFTITSDWGTTTVTITINGTSEPPCFVRGTMIDTPHGPRAIEDLAAGDTVLTADAGPQTILWISSKVVPAAVVEKFDALRPVRILKDTFGPGVLGHDLQLSPMHRVLLRGSQASLNFGTNEVFCPIKLLVNGQTILRDPAGTVEYFHVLFEQHQVIRANGCPTESFLPGQIGLENFEPDAQEEVFALFPELRSLPNSFGPAARRILRRHEAKVFSDDFRPQSGFADLLNRVA